MIELLKSVGITHFNDKEKKEDDSQDIELNEIDPFTFYCYIYKYGERRRLYFLQEIAKKIGIEIPTDGKGIPSAQAQKVWLFPYKYDRENKEISRLWAFFKNALNDKITDSDFSNVLEINNVGKTKLTEALFYVDPKKYLPINGPTKPFIENELGIKPNFDTYSEYVTLLETIKTKTIIPFYELSYEAWQWNENKKNNKMSTESSYSDQLLSFLEQAKTNNLKTKHFKKAYKNTKVKVSFGQGNSAKIPWISFLKEPFTTSDGIYPVYLYYKNIDKLILAYGRSETNRPSIEWNINNPQRISKYFEDNNFEKPDRYGDSHIFCIYDVNDLPNKKKLNQDLNEIIEKYFQLKTNEQLKNVSSMKFDFKTFQTDCQNSGLTYSTSLITRYISSLATKPFVLLSGLSGSGKTKLAEAYAKWICESDNQYCIVPVGADWTNREPLLGYVNALEDEKYILPENGALRLIIEANKEENKERPYFLILDEMNLSHVERYFADFLSVMESKDKFKLHSSDLPLDGGNGIEVEKGYGWPDNLFVVGTVNIDETTYMFSPKVLDRANVIEFRVKDSEMGTFLEGTKPLNLSKLKDEDGIPLGAKYGESFVKIAEGEESDEKLSFDKKLKDTLSEFFKKLQEVGAEFGYRTASEIQTLYSQMDLINPDFNKDEDFAETYNTKEDFKIDVAIMQKLLPKLHGSRNKLVDVLTALAIVCYGIGEDNELTKEDKKDVFNKSDDLKDKIVYPISLEKIERMYKNVIANGFTSYAEA
ncbi:MAG: DUF3578 domain-containing protein [Flavobacteriales bacterium]